MEIKQPLAKPKRATLPRFCRLLKRRDYEQVYSSGKKIHCQAFLLIVSPTELPCTRLGIAVTVKIDKRSSVRNGIRRRIREIFRLNRTALLKPLDLVVIAKNRALECDYAEMERQITGALRHHGYLPRKQPSVARNAAETEAL